MDRRLRQARTEGCQEALGGRVEEQATELLDVLALDPFQNARACEKLVGDLDGAYSRRINIHHRLVYEVFKKERAVRVLRMWSHFE